jgi:hypothetical protein
MGLMLTTCQNFNILAYRRIRGRDFCPESPEVAKLQKNLSRPIGRTHVTRSTLSGIRTSEVREGIFSASRVTKSRENHSRPSKEDRRQRSRDIVNSKVHRVRAQELGAPSHEIVRSQDSRWIQVTGVPLD